MKKLGFGCMRLPLNDKKNNGDINTDETKKMFDRFLDEGFTYFDTAYMYHDGQSEKIVGTCLADRHDRDSFLLASKMPMGTVKKKADVPRIFEEQKAKCHVDYFDYYLLHAMNAVYLVKAEKLGVFDYLLEKKKAGEIKRLGLSFHDSARVLDKILTRHPEMEFVQLQINYLDWDNMRIQSRKCYEVARKHGKDIIVMEPVKGGALANVPKIVSDMMKDKEEHMSPASWAVRFAASLPGVIMVLSGMSDMAQLEDNMSYMKDFTPITDGEKEMLMKAKTLIKNSKIVPCTACRYCTAGCPKDIPIPEYFAAHNKKITGETDYKEYFSAATDKAGKAADCIKCKQCEKACPQKIEITKWLKKCSLD